MPLEWQVLKPLGTLSVAASRDLPSFLEGWVRSRLLTRQLCTLRGSWPSLSAGDACFSLFLGGKLNPPSGTCSLPSHRQASRLPVFDPVSARRLHVPPMALVPNSWLVSMSLPFLCSRSLSCGTGAGRKLGSGRHGEAGPWLQVPVPDLMLLSAGLFLPSTPPCHGPTLLPSPLPSF